MMHLMLNFRVLHQIHFGALQRHLSEPYQAFFRAEYHGLYEALNSKLDAVQQQVYVGMSIHADVVVHK